MKIIKTALLFTITIEFATATAQLPAKKEEVTDRVKTDSLSKMDYQQTLAGLGIRLPVLPAMAEDSGRPRNLTARTNGGGFTDSAGRYVTRSSWGAWVNYDEDKANNYTLADPLRLKNGEPVTDADTWWKKRRPEIIMDYENNVFGHIPKTTPAVAFKIIDVDKAALNGIAIKKTITGYIDNSPYPQAKPVINMVCYLPAKSHGPAPLMIVAAPNTKGNTETIQLLINSGWAIAIFDTYGLQADNGAGLSAGIIGLLNHGQSRRPEDWGVLRAWSWGLGRALDYFQTDKAIDPKRIGVEGHSRWGKTALLAGAMDTRWAFVFASCSGSGGASLEKRNFGENLDLIASAGEYHWMAPNFLKYGGNWNAFPVDAHEMMALIAPRPLFITGGTQDTWADPVGEFKACVAATPVYNLLGVTGITAREMPEPDVSLIDGRLAFRLHAGGHVDSIDWPVFLEFARKQR